MDNYVDLDVVGVLENTDKSSAVRIGWDYLRHYERLFEAYRGQPVHVVEIGVFGGASLRMWKWFFPRARLTGIDIDPACQAHADDRVRIEIGSQDDTDLLNRVCGGDPPSIVIDDGSHTAEHRIATFQHVFPLMAPGGIYVIEDFAVHTASHAPADAASGVQEPPSGADYFVDIGRICFANGKVKTSRDIPAALTQLVDETVFFANAVALRKRDPRRDVERALATADSHFGKHRATAQGLENLAKYVVQHHGPLDRALALVQSAVDTHGASMSRSVMRAEIALASNDLEDVRQAVAHALDQRPGGLGIVLRLAKLQETLGDLEGAIRTVESAAAKSPQLGLLKRRLRELRTKARPTG